MIAISNMNKQSYDFCILLLLLSKYIANYKLLIDVLYIVCVHVYLCVIIIAIAILIGYVLYMTNSLYTVEPVILDQY